MRIGIPVWNNWVSPVLDTAGTLLLVDIERLRETGRSVVSIDTPEFAQKVRRICELDVDVIICNAVSRGLLELLSLPGKEVIPMRSGPVDEIVSAYLEGNLHAPRYVVGDCCANKGGGPRRNRGKR